jgi:hypothetical protein
MENNIAAAQVERKLQINDLSGLIQDLPEREMQLIHGGDDSCDGGALVADGLTFTNEAGTTIMVAVETADGYVGTEPCNSDAYSGS